MKFSLSSIVALVVTVLTAVATASSETIQAFWGAHGEAGPLVLMGFGVLKLFLPSPLSVPVSAGPQIVEL